MGLEILRPVGLEAGRPEAGRPEAGRPEAGRPEAGALRYHPLFVALLRHEAGVRLPAELPDLHRRAAGWLVAQGDPVTAVEHAAAIPDWRYAAELVLGYALPQLYSTAGDRVRAVLGRLARGGADVGDPEIGTALALAFPGTPPVADDRLAALPLVRQEAVRVTGQLIEVERAYQRGAPAELLALCDAALCDVAPCDVALCDAAPCDAALYDAALGDAQPAVAVTGPAEGLAPVFENYQGIGELWCGRFDAAAQHLTSAANAAQSAGLSYVEAQARGHHALLLALSGRLHAAQQAGIDATRRAHAAGVPAGSCTLLALWLVQLLRGGPDSVEPTLAGARTAPEYDPAPLAVALIRARGLGTGEPGGWAGVEAARVRLGDRPVPPLLRGWLAAARADGYLHVGDPAAALTTVGEFLDSRADLRTAPAYLAAARAQLATGEYRPARKLLAAVLAGGAGPNGPDLDTRVAAGMLEALAADALECPGAVRIAIARAVSSAAAERLVRPFRLCGAAGQQLLRHHGDLVAAEHTLAGRLGAPAAADAGRARRSAVTGGAVGKAAVRGGAASGGAARGSAAAGSRATGPRANPGLPPTGSRAAGSRAAGSRAAGSRAAGSRAAGSGAAGSRATGSRATGSWTEGSWTEGSRGLRDHVLRDRGLRDCGLRDRGPRDRRLRDRGPARAPGRSRVPGRVWMSGRVRARDPDGDRGRDRERDG